MARYLLYYAGMAQDQKTEQIGLAVSEDGEHFKRQGSDGLILAVDKALEWKNLRVCNPTVIKDGDEYLMFYQGVGVFLDGVTRTSIGLARSRDGLEWTAESQPLIDWRRLQDEGISFAPGKRIDIIEPSVLKEGDTFRMWFVLRHATYPGNVLFHTDSRDLKHWRIDPAACLKGNCFGPYSLYYPQVLKEENGGYKLYFTLNNMHNHSYGIFTMRSADGAIWERLDQLLPGSYDGLVLKPREYITTGIYSWGLRKIFQKVNRFLNSVFHRGRNYYGYAHPHRLEDGERTLFYIQNVNDGAKRRTLDIAVYDFKDERLCNHRQALESLGRSSAWDAEFVADPFVIKI